MPLLVDREALPYVLPTPECVVAARMGGTMQRIVRELTVTPRSAERPSVEPQFAIIKGHVPMRSVSSMAARPMQPLWQSLPAIEAMLAPLNHKRYKK